MEGSRPNPGAWLACISGAALLVVMTALDWYEVSVPENVRRLAGGSSGLTYNAWDAFNLIDSGLLYVGVLAIALCIAALLRLQVVLRVGSLLVAAAGAGAVIVLAYRIADPPTLTFKGNEIREVGGVEINTELGAFLGLIAAVGILVGGVLAIRQSGASPGRIVQELEGKLEQRPEEPPSSGPQPR
jgi:hypothetical protein